MVKALINIDEDTNRLLAMIKAQFGLKDKSQAIEVLAEEYEELISEHRVRPAFLKKLKKMEKGRKIRIGTIKDFKKMYSIK
ncbi:MAG: DUF2683 family protein [Candidatus Marsarchaeota archaeon]|jgi:hypothetical protein|nr:DUF2683 family protein [Candidatus Marsarchaeota archaeon]